MTQGTWSDGTAGWFSSLFSRPRDSEWCSISSGCRSGLFLVSHGLLLVLLLLLLMSVSRGCCQISELDLGDGSGLVVSPIKESCLNQKEWVAFRGGKYWKRLGQHLKRLVIHFYLLVGFVWCLQDWFRSGVSIGELILIGVQRFMPSILAVILCNLQCVFSHSSSETGLLWACFWTSEALNGFYVTPRSGANYF